MFENGGEDIHLPVGILSSTSRLKRAGSNLCKRSGEK